MADLIFADVFNKYRNILDNILKTKPSSRVTLSINQNRTKILAVAIEFIAVRDKQKERRAGGLCFVIYFICVYMCVVKGFFVCFYVNTYSNIFISRLLTATSTLRSLGSDSRM